jgi:hypothetical protein
MEQIKEVNVDEISNRLIILETRFSERWDAHDKQAKERNEAVKLQLEDINAKMDCMMRRPCIEHTEQLKSVGGQVNWVWSLLVVLFVSVLGIIIKVFLGINI